MFALIIHHSVHDGLSFEIMFKDLVHCTDLKSQFSTY